MFTGMTLDLADDEKAALVAHLRRALEYDPFPFAPQLDPLKAILAKLEPPKPQPETLPMWTCPGLVERDWFNRRPFFRTEPGL